MCDQTSIECHRLSRIQAFTRSLISISGSLVFVLALYLPMNANATLFRNSYVSFELPPNWECKLDGTEWVCVSKYEKQSKEAIIILTAKEVGPTDSIESYTAHLKTPRSLPNKSGKMVSSQVISVQSRVIANHPWVDGMQKGSEIASYYTRYLATIKERLAILVTFSAHVDHYTKYSNDFLQAVESLRVVAAKDILETKVSSSANTGGGVIGNPIYIPPDQGGNVTLPPEPKSQDLKSKLLGLALLLVAVGIYLWRKKKK